MHLIGVIFYHKVGNTPGVALLEDNLGLYWDSGIVSGFWISRQVFVLLLALLVKLLYADNPQLFTNF